MHVAACRAYTVEIKRAMSRLRSFCVHTAVIFRLQCMAIIAAVRVFALGVVALLAATGSRASGVDVNQTNANGSSVVLLAIARVQQSGVFGSDNEMLRRIAFVETRDGTLPGTFRQGYNGGIWAVNESVFLFTKRADSNPRLPSKLEQVEDRLGIDWLAVQWSDLRRPLYSAVAARLILYLARGAIPASDNVEGQARFWVQQYNMNGVEGDYIGATTGLEGK